jgi:hypothetical protein
MRSVEGVKRWAALPCGNSTETNRFRSTLGAGPIPCVLRLLLSENEALGRGAVRANWALLAARTAGLANRAAVENQQVASNPARSFGRRCAGSAQVAPPAASHACRPPRRRSDRKHCPAPRWLSCGRRRPVPSARPSFAAPSPHAARPAPRPCRAATLPCCDKTPSSECRAPAPPAAPAHNPPRCDTS